MTDAAIISGQLVDVRNVGTHKCVKLTIHVPAEYAPKVFECFGWPTGVDPVPVALARLVEGGDAIDPPPRQNGEATNNKRPDTRPRVESAPRGAFNDMPPVKQAGILCADPVFWKYLNERGQTLVHVENEEDAAFAVRRVCHVESRKDIVAGTDAHHKWDLMLKSYRAWQREPEYV